MLLILKRRPHLRTQPIEYQRSQPNGYGAYRPVLVRHYSGRPSINILTTEGRENMKEEYGMTDIEQAFLLWSMQ